MPVEVFNPDGLPKPEVYRQVAVATGSRTVYMAGQVAGDADGSPVGAGDLAAQVEQAYVNVGTAVAAAGGTFDDVAKLTLYVVDWSEEKFAALGRASTAPPRGSGSTRSSRSPSSRSRRWASPPAGRGGRGRRPAVGRTGMTQTAAFEAEPRGLSGSRHGC